MEEGLSLSHPGHRHYDYHYRDTITSVSVAGGALQPLLHIKSQLSKHC